MDVDSLSVQLEELRAAKPAARSLLLPAASLNERPRSFCSSLSWSRTSRRSSRTASLPRSAQRKADEAVDTADTLPDRQPEDLDTQQDEVADVEVDSEAEALAAEADLEAGAHEAARVVAARKAADAQLALEDPASQEAAARLKICCAQIEKVFCLPFVSRSEACPACSRGLSLLRFTVALRFALSPCRSGPWPADAACADGAGGRKGLQRHGPRRAGGCCKDVPCLRSRGSQSCTPLIRPRLRRWKQEDACPVCAQKKYRHDCYQCT